MDDEYDVQRVDEDGGRAEGLGGAELLLVVEVVEAGARLVLFEDAAVAAVVDGDDDGGLFGDVVVALLY